MGTNVCTVYNKGLISIMQKAFAQINFKSNKQLSRKMDEEHRQTIHTRHTNI